MNELEWNAFQCERLNKTEKNKIILCEAREDNVSRLFIHQFSYWSNALTKSGWWDTFTISKLFCKKGLYLCSIDEFRIDRNGFLNLVVSPLKYLGEDISEESSAWDLFSYTGRFCAKYQVRKDFPRFNIDNLFNIYIEGDRPEYISECCDYIFNKFLNDEISLQEIEVALDEKDAIEKLSEDLVKNIARGTDKYLKYPLICKKLPNDDGTYRFCDVESWLRRKLLEYKSLHLDGCEDILDKVEAVLQYWVDFHKKEKEAKKAAKKAAKANL